jgi:hypothetical protein
MDWIPPDPDTFDWSQFPQTSVPGIVGGNTPGTQGKVSVMDPSRPGTLIWVAATPDANGDLVPVDPRYRGKQPEYGNLLSPANSGGSSLVWLLVIAGLGIVAYRVLGS